MNSRRHLTLVAGASAVLAAMPLATVFEQWTWLVYAILLVGALCGVAVLVRSTRSPFWMPTVAMGAVYILIMTWLFPSGKEFAAVIPDLDTARHFNALLLTASEEMRTYGVPVEDRPGFLFLATLGVGLVAILVDVCTVVARRPALAGLPMLAIYSVPVAVHKDSISIWPFVLGAAGFLWLLVSDNVDRVRRFGRRFTGDGRDIDVWEPSPLAAAGQRLGLIGITLAVLLPLAVPGMTGGLLTRMGGGAGTGSGPGNGVGAGVGLQAMLEGELRRDKPIAMVKVTTDDPNPYYLRFATADQLDPNGFTVRNAPRGRATSQGLPEPQVGQGGVVQRHRASVDIVNFNTKFLPVYLQPAKIDSLDDTWEWDPQQSVVFSNSDHSQKKKYAFEYGRVEYSPEVLGRSKPLAPNDPTQRRFTQTPRVAAVDELVRNLTAGKTTPYDRVRAVFDHFSPANGFTYSLTTEPGNTGSALADFLQNKKGYCVQYAAALAWMVRVAGVPARVAFGFTRGSAPAGGTTTATLTNFNLHSWTEVYLDGFGWLPFDATPATNVLGSVSPLYAPNPSRPSDAQPSAADDTQAPNTPDSAASAAPLGPERGDTGVDSAAGPVTPLPERWPIWTVLGVLGTLLLLAVPAARRMAVRRRRLRFSPVAVGAPSRQDGASATGSSDGAPPGAVPPGAVPPGSARPLVVVPDDASQLAARMHAHAVWDELLDTMTDYRVPVDEAETPRATAERLVRQAHLDKPSPDPARPDQARPDPARPDPARPDQAGVASLPASGVRLLGRAEERARYSRTAHPEGDLGQALTAIRAALAGRASRRTRLRAVLLPPSVVASWRLAVLGGSSALFNGVARRADSVTRLLSVRRLMAGRTGRA
ncbi:MAG TPA: transglutaminaseTgpA domain-containing protein [Micromonosporaceae bacterium]|nr:transglutaminaseTgpA domain-containing protein [Micromonosporaceae bacterium]